MITETAKRGVLRLFCKKDYICREGCKKSFYIRKVVLFIEDKFYPQFSKNLHICTNPHQCPTKISLKMRDANKQPSETITWNTCTVYHCSSRICYAYSHGLTTYNTKIAGFTVVPSPRAMMLVSSNKIGTTYWAQNNVGRLCLIFSPRVTFTL